MSQHDSQGCLFSVYGVQVGSHLHTARHHKPRVNTWCQQTAGRWRAEARRCRQNGKASKAPLPWNVVIRHRGARLCWSLFLGHRGIVRASTLPQLLREAKKVEHISDLNPGKGMRDSSLKRKMQVVQRQLLFSTSPAAVTLFQCLPTPRSWKAHEVQQQVALQHPAQKTQRVPRGHKER